MPGRDTIAAEKGRQLALRQLQDLAARHAAIVLFTRRARAGLMDCDRAIALIEAVVERYAVVQVMPQVDPGKVQIRVVASPDAPPAVRQLLDDAQLKALDPAEQAMVDAMIAAREASQ